MGAGSRRIRDALAIACVVALCPPGAGAADGEREGSSRPARGHACAGRGAASALRDCRFSSRRRPVIEDAQTFVARGPGYDLTVTAAEAALTLRKAGQADAGTPAHDAERRAAGVADRGARPAAGQGVPRDVGVARYPQRQQRLPPGHVHRRLSRHRRHLLRQRAASRVRLPGGAATRPEADSPGILRRRPRQRSRPTASCRCG